MKTVSLTEICTPRQHKQLSKKNLSSSGHPVYGANGVIGYYHQYNHEAPVIALGCRGNCCGSVHITAPYSYVTANALCLENLHEDFSIDYLYHYLKQYDFSALISGAAQPQLTAKRLHNIQVPYATLAQQKHIADILSQAEQCIQLRKEQLSQLPLLRQSCFMDAMEDIKQRGAYTKHRLGHIAHIHCGKRNAGEMDEDGMHPLFTCAKEPRKIKHFAYDCECVLVSGNIDFHVHYYKGKFDAYQRIYIIESKNKKRVIVPFLHAYLEHYLPQLQAQAIGGVMKYLKREMLTEFPLLLPSAAEQARIVAKLAEIKTIQANAQEALTREELLFKTLQHQYFAY